MTDTMLFGVLKMPFEMAMSDEISRLQYYARVQELVGRFEAQQQAEPVDCWDVDEDNPDSLLKHPAFQATPEPVGMPMPRVGDRVICLEDESLGTVVSLTAGGSPDITFDDGSRGTYLLREFAELFGYFTPPAQRPWVSLTDGEINANRTLRYHFSLNNGPVTRAGIAVVETIEAMLKAKNHG